jgi:hypothetical protein
VDGIRDRDSVIAGVARARLRRDASSAGVTHHGADDSMFTWFRRGDEFLRYEAREVSKNVYQLTIMLSDGTETVEQYSDEHALADRQSTLQTELESQGWTGPHGWNL